MSATDNPNTSSGYRAVLTFKNKIVGDQIADAIIAELERRGDIEIDIEAAVDDLTKPKREKIVADATSPYEEMTFEWNNGFDDLTYDFNVYPTSVDQATPFTWFLVRQTLTSITIGFIGLTDAASFVCVARE